MRRSTVKCEAEKSSNATEKDAECTILLVQGCGDYLTLHSAQHDSFTCTKDTEKEAKSN